MAAIEISQLGKRYLLGQAREQSETLASSAWRMITAPLKRFRRLGGAQVDQPEFWALRNLSLTIDPGEIVGIVGRNGAGKSTLLKLLARTTVPTTGRIIAHGRLQSLLEVGTGFHPDLTGRENVYLNGAILGLKRHEIAARFDEIVAFSEIERFLDTPVKRYSSGMYVRLAFAVAAHLNPEILIVDEVLAVGDFAFQQKCLARMKQLHASGRTLLFVSHNLAAIENLCTRAILLEHGQLKFDGPPREVIARYTQRRNQRSKNTALIERTDRDGDGRLRVKDVWLEDDHGQPLDVVHSGQNVTFACAYQRSDEVVRGVVPSLALVDGMGRSLLLHRSNFSGQSFDAERASGVFRCRIADFPLAEGLYSLGINLAGPDGVFDNIGDTLPVSVAPGDFFGTGQVGITAHTPFLVRGSWSLDTNDARSGQPATLESTTDSTKRNQAALAEA